MTVVIIGARGMLGTELTKVCEDNGITVTPYDLPELDITNSEQITQALQDCDFVVNCSAYTNVEKAEIEQELALQVNGNAVGQLGQIAKEKNLPVLHISTDFVFDGNLNRPYIETDQTNAISAYGASKLEGEKQLQASGCTCCIVRVQWTYGAAGINFVKKILQAAQTRDSLKVVDDQIGSPTATKEAAKTICELIQQNTFPEGIYHLAADGYVSRFEMAKYLCDLKGITIPIEPCKTSDFPSAAKRPLNSRFNCDKLTTLLGHKMRPWQEPLKEYLESL